MTSNKETLSEQAFPSTLEITKNLIRRQSISPKDEGCQAYMQSLLADLDFNFEAMDFGDTQNLWATRQGNPSDKSTEQPVFVFAGHTDVVPAGSLEKWNTDPFEPSIIDDHLYGRGAADMKTSLAAMITATRRFVKKHPQHKGSIAFLITSDEEAKFINGTVKVVEALMQRGQVIDYALVGEPSSTQQLGDVIKIGRRGSLTGWLKIHGKQGHVAYPHLAENAIHTAAYFLEEVTKIQWDEGNQYFPATSLQITSIQGGQATNIIPGEIDIEFNFRFSTEFTAEQLQQKMQAFVDKHCENSELEWQVNGDPFITQGGALIEASCKAIKEVCDIETSLQTSGGTSDGRFIAKMGAQIVEIGPINATIHQVNESVKIEDIEKLADIYFHILKNLLT